MVRKIHGKFRISKGGEDALNNTAEDDDYKFYLHHVGATDHLNNGTQSLN